MADVSLPAAPVARANILSIAPYIGGEAKSGAIQPKRLIRLASNESAYGTPPGALEAVRESASESFRYPDGVCEALRESLGTHFRLPPERIVCGAGSEELIRLLAAAYAGPGDEVVFSQYGFLMYPIAARLTGAEPISAPEDPAILTADVDALLARVTPRTRLLYLANPNNPTGTLLPAREIRRLHQALPPHVLLVLDAAYAEYVDPTIHPDYEAGDGLVSSGNVVVLRTFSKIYGLAGLRLGWAHCPPSVADALNRVRGPFNVSLPAQKAGIAALADQAFIADVRQRNGLIRARFTAQLSALCPVTPSAANFALADFGERAEQIHLALKEEGILVRQMGAYGLGHMLRITIGTAEDMEEVFQAIKRLL